MPVFLYSPSIRGTYAFNQSIKLSYSSRTISASCSLPVSVCLINCQFVIERIRDFCIVMKVFTHSLLLSVLTILLCCMLRKFEVFVCLTSNGNCWFENNRIETLVIESVPRLALFICQTMTFQISKCIACHHKSFIFH